MKKYYLIAIFFFFITITNAQRNTFFYADTIFEFNQLKFEINETISFWKKNKLKLNITNLTDSFKIINPVNILNTDNDIKYTLKEKDHFVIEPKSTRSFICHYSDRSFKQDHLKYQISQIQTTDKVQTSYVPTPFSLDKVNQRKAKLKNFPTQQIGSLKLEVKDILYNSNGSLVIALSVKYDGSGFLGINYKKIKVVTSDGRVFINHKQSKMYKFHNGKAKNCYLKFENPCSVNAQSDFLVLDNVFVEYNLIDSDQKIDFTLHKKKVGFRNPLKKKKEKNGIEVIED